MHWEGYVRISLWEQEAGRRDSVLKDGLVLHSDYKGEIVIHPEHVVPVAEIGEQDYIFVCVKNYSLEEVCADLKSAVTDGP